MGARIKGQEASLVMLVDGAPQEELVDCRSWDLSWKTELLQEGYMGETTDRYDTVYHGVSGNAEFHIENASCFNLIQMIVDKARRREPGTRFNLKLVWNIPSGTKVRVIVPDIEFGELPTAFGSRTDYGTFKFEFGASEANFLPA